jgi:hypothetical protein
MTPSGGANLRATPCVEYWGQRKAVGRRDVSSHVSAALILPSLWTVVASGSIVVVIMLVAALIVAATIWVERRP